MSAIAIKDLKFYYSHFQSSFSLEILNWKIEEGEFVSLIGPNGCGKSTLLRLIVNLLKPNYGEIEIFDKKHHNIKLKDFAKVVAFVPQSNFSVFHFSVYEIVMMGRNPYLNLLGFDNVIDREIVEEALSIMEIEHLKSKGINEISGGEAQRVFIARALAQKAKILLLDEPNAHLDIEHQIQIFNLLKKLNQEKKLTVVSVSHDLNLVGVYSERITIMEQGRIKIDGNSKIVLTENNIKNVFNVESSIFRSEKTASVNILINPINF